MWKAFHEQAGVDRVVDEPGRPQPRRSAHLRHLQEPRHGAPAPDAEGAVLLHPERRLHLYRAAT